MIYATRFAPSPTGPLHLGHAYSAILAHDSARAAGGRFHLRLDDIDQSRARPAWAQQIKDDLQWLGLTWDGPVWSQFARHSHYNMALEQLWSMGLLYPCLCSRADIKAAANAPQEGAPMIGPDGLIYPGTCRTIPKGEMPKTSVLRLNIKKAIQSLDIKSVCFSDREKILHRSAAEMIAQIGDVVLSRKNMAASYHLSIVVDDADQRITHIIRGEDLREATFIHVLLQRLLGYATPEYTHHKLIRDEQGKRLAKRDDARALSTYRLAGHTPVDIRQMIGL
ncbi:MAG: tRNA glutamyl-Q(34) synthetase GluQRS [Planktotalea sp.]|uniref:tRNA glutamyl-Q(34) synthetase GluQRS n=1 Tax=Planktotalea sp. TaxID=2029877 RepID=UPI003C71F8F8